MNTQSNRRSTRSALLAIAAVAALFAADVRAQYRVDNGSARDANNRIGSGGFNDRVVTQQRVGGLAGNYIVTGNVTGGRSFRGALGYTDPSAFRGSLGSASFDTFYRDSIGFGTARGGYGNNNNFGAVQPYFGPGRTVAPPAGFVRDPSRGGGYVVAPRTLIQNSDARLDYGGASRAQIQQGYVGNSRVIGGAGLAAGTNGVGISPFDVSAPQATSFQLSEYTTLNRPRLGLYDTPIGSGPLSGDPAIDRLRRSFQPNSDRNNAQLPAVPTPDGTPGTTPPGGARDTRIDQNSPLNGVTPTGGPLNEGLRPNDANNPTNNSTNSPTNNLSPTGPRDPNAPPPSPGNTGQGSSVRNLRAVDNNGQYAALRQRLEATDRTRRLPGSEAVDRANESNAIVIAQRKAEADRAAAARTAAGQGTGTNGQPGAPNQPGQPDKPGAPLSGQPAGQQPIGQQRVGGQPLDGRPGTGGANMPPLAGGTTRPAVPEDTLNLPRPQETGIGPTERPADETADDAPMFIRSLATDVKDKPLADALTQAETLMKDGKFGSAIEVYERAEQASSDDPLIFMGSSIAELGGSYYRRSETHLRQAFAGDRALLVAKFDLRSMLTDARLNFLVTDLGDVARTNAKDPGPLLLLAFIYYNSGMEDRAARALAMAQTRAGGNDPTVTLLQQNWKLPTVPSGATLDEPTK